MGESIGLRPLGPSNAKINAFEQFFINTGEHRSSAVITDAQG